MSVFHTHRPILIVGKCMISLLFQDRRFKKECFLFKRKYMAISEKHSVYLTGILEFCVQCFT